MISLEWLLSLKRVLVIISLEWGCC